VIAGNDQPSVKVAITGGNKTFYFPNTPLKYAVQVSDKEEGTTADGKISAKNVKVTFDYLKGYDMTIIAQGHQMPTAEHPGKGLMEKSDCKSCHTLGERSAGPAYKEISSKYLSEKGAVDMLAAKIIKGGAGVWGTTEMAAHPQITVEDARKMVQYILTLSSDQGAKSLPLSGAVTPGKDEEGAYFLTATYFDKGANGLPSVAGSDAAVLRSPMLKADHASELKVARVVRFNGNAGLENVKNGSWAAYKNIDLSGVKKASISGFIMADQNVGGEVQVRLDKPDGKLLGKVMVTKPGVSSTPVKLEAADGIHDLYFVFINPKSGDSNLFFFGGAKLENK
jgi:cytochrome c